jgi:alpha-tubulin suppressor-like RCC1 family protein
VTDSVLADADPTPVAIGRINDAKQLALSTGNSCVLRATGHVFCWGGSERGELGNGTVTASEIPTAVFDLRDAVQITARGESACARRATGQVVCWGRNAEGQLGDGAHRDPKDPAKAGRSTPVLVPGITDAIDVSTSGDHTCIVSHDGSVTCWGLAASGEVGTVASEGSVKPVAVVWP